MKTEAVNGEQKEVMPRPKAPPLDAQSYVLPISGKEKIHVSTISKESVLQHQNYSSFAFDDVRTVYDCIRRGVKESVTGNFLGQRPNKDSGYEWLTYETTIKRSVNFGRGLMSLGLKPKDLVGIYSKNRVEWVLTDQALLSFSIVSVPIYDSLGAAACKFVIEQAELTTIVVEDSGKLEKLVTDEIGGSVKNVISIEEVREDLKKQVKALGWELHRFHDVEKLGEDHSETYPEQPPEPDDIATINYTSGTSGEPRGVILTHKNLVAAAGSYYMHTRMCRFKVNKYDVVISFLPLAHIYERIFETVIAMVGGSIGFYSGDVLKLTEDLRWLQPTIVPCVPRLLNKIYDRVMAAANSSRLKKYVMKIALSAKAKEVRLGILRRDSIWDYLVFSKIQDLFGGRVRILVSGGAPISNEILIFYRCALGCIVFEGYGQTETTGATALTLSYDTEGGHVGPPLACCAVKLTDVPEMNYTAKNYQGEICVKGPHVSSGYFKNPEETSSTFGPDGWLHTGDIGMWLPNGTLKIIDRKKNIFKLSQGEYIAPEKIEIIYSRCPSVAQVFVYGDSFQSFLVAIVVPEAELLQNPDTSSEEPQETLEFLCHKPELKAQILEEMISEGKKRGLLSFEQVKDIYLHPEAFTLEQDLLTPTMKIKRQELKRAFAIPLRRMYAQSPEGVMNPALIQ